MTQQHISSKSAPAPRKVKVDPQPPLLQQMEPQRSRRGLDRNRLIMWGAVIVIAGQLMLPPDLKPFKLAGDAAAQFHGALFDEVNRKELELIQQQEVARKIAELQAEYSEWKGRCAMVGAFDGQLGQLCYMGAENFYQEALAQIRRSELMYR